MTALVVVDCTLIVEAEVVDPVLVPIGRPDVRLLRSVPLVTELSRPEVVTGRDTPSVLELEIEEAEELELVALGTEEVVEIVEDD